ncbi:unnamed protein product [Merluccius merluccius]
MNNGSLGYMDLDDSQPSLASNTGGNEVRTPWTDSDDLSQWQSEFRGQIRALRHWLKSMEMKLPPLDPTGGSSEPIVARAPGRRGRRAGALRWRPGLCTHERAL